MQYLYFLQLKKRSDISKKSPRRFSKEEIKKRSIDSLFCNEKNDKENLNVRENTVEDYQEAMNIIKEYEDILHIDDVKFLENLKKTENLKVLLNNLK